jgi:hypothetical protein
MPFGAHDNALLMQFGNSAASPLAFVMPTKSWRTLKALQRIVTELEKELVCRGHVASQRIHDWLPALSRHINRGA